MGDEIGVHGMAIAARRPIRIAAAIVAISALAIGAAPAEAKKQSTSTKLKTATSAAVTANRGNAGEAPIATATAFCPGKTNAVAGGFTASPPNIPIGWGTALTWVNIFESQMVGDDAWRVSAKQFVQNGIGSVAAHVYCQRREKALEVELATVALPSTMNAATGVTASCPSGKALSGGFLTPPPTDANMSYVTSSLRAPNTGWTADATTIAGSPGTLTSYVYCGKARKIKERFALTPVTPPGGSLHTATPADCPKTYKPFSGGFVASAQMGLMNTALIYDTRRDGRTWIASAGPSNNSTSAGLASYSYCRRR